MITDERHSVPSTCSRHPAGRRRPGDLHTLILSFGRDEVTGKAHALNRYGPSTTTPPLCLLDTAEVGVQE